MATLYIGKRWTEGKGTPMVSFNPVNDAVIWEGKSATQSQIDEAIIAAEQALKLWGSVSFEKRIDYLTKFNDILTSEKEAFQEIISRENGKPLWEAAQEVEAMLSKLPISIEAYRDRCKHLEKKSGLSVSRVIHKPHGIVAIFSPFNFPAHLPNGHIIPALLAGNTVILKPSEHTPAVAQKMVEYWEKANLPAGVINLIQGGPDVGKMLSQHPRLDGLFFTGSFRTGQQLSQYYGQRPEKILALEMGGNNPLIVHQVGNIIPAVYQTIQSAYITSGQRCTCARRLIVTKGSQGELFIAKLIEALQKIAVGPYTDWPEPFMGPVISKEASDHIQKEYNNLLEKNAQPLVQLQTVKNIKTLLSPGLVDVTSVKNLKDEEIFGPLLQLHWVDNIDMAIQEANRTDYGLSAGIFCDDEKIYRQALEQLRSGVVNWNRPTTGGSSRMPFGGIGKSGNFRPTAYYAADYCAYPVSVLEEKELSLPSNFTPGIEI